MSVPDPARVSIQTRQNTVGALGRGQAVGVRERTSATRQGNPAVYITTSPMGERAARLSNMLDELRAAIIRSTPEESPGMIPKGREFITEKLDEAGSGEEAQAAEETLALARADQVAFGLVQGKFSITTPVDRNILQHFTG